MTRTGCAVLGATGAVGQRFVALLADHPWFELRAVVGRSSAGRRYRDATSWHLDTPMPEAAATLEVQALDGLPGPRDLPLVFSALPGGAAGAPESALAARGHKVFTNARDHRMDDDVPLLVPEVNADHLELVRRQPGPGWIVANGNCTAIVLTLALAPLHRAFGLESVHVTTLQALSGAGYPGVASLDIADNVLPHIPGEEEKVAEEPQKTLGRLTADGVAPAGIPIHATCTRVAVREGHLESVHARLAHPVRLADAEEALRSFCGPDDVRSLPSAPAPPLHVHTAADRPQPRRDAGRGAGMAVSVGRLRLSADGRDLRLIALGSNTVRGAAGASLLNAELARARGFV